MKKVITVLCILALACKGMASNVQEPVVEASTITPSVAVDEGKELAQCGPAGCGTRSPGRRTWGMPPQPPPTAPCGPQAPCGPGGPCGGPIPPNVPGCNCPPPQCPVKCSSPPACAFGTACGLSYAGMGFAVILVVALGAIILASGESAHVHGH